MATVFETIGEGIEAFPINSSMYCKELKLKKKSIRISTQFGTKNLFPLFSYSEVPNRRADQNKRAGLEKSATMLAYLLSKLINEQGGIFRLLHEKLQAGWKENLTNLSEHALLLGTSE